MWLKIVFIFIHFAFSKFLGWHFFKLISAKEPVLAEFEWRSSADSFRVSSWPPRPPHGVPDQGEGRAPSDSCHRASAQACALGEGPTTNGACAGLFWVCLPGEGMSCPEVRQREPEGRLCSGASLSCPALSVTEWALWFGGEMQVTCHNEAC